MLILIAIAVNPAFAQNLREVCAKTAMENKFIFKLKRADTERSISEGGPVQSCPIADYLQGEDCFKYSVTAYWYPLDLNGDQYFDLVMTANSGIPGETNYSLALFANCGDDIFIHVFDSDALDFNSDLFSPGLTGLWVIQPGDKNNWATLQANRTKNVYSENGDMDKEYVQYFIMKFDPKHFKYKIVKKSKIRDSEYQPSDRRPAIPMPFKPKIIIDE
jgi:hypothetical protein